MKLASTDDKWGEAWVAARLASFFDCRVVRLSEYDRIDYYGVRDGEVVFVSEVKRRKATRYQYPTFYLALRKWTALMLAAQWFKVKPLYIVQWTDQLCYFNVLDVTGPLVIRGRNDRGLENDMEPMIEVPVEKFTLIEEMR